MPDDACLAAEALSQLFSDELSALSLVNLSMKKHAPEHYATHHRGERMDAYHGVDLGPLCWQIHRNSH